MKDFSQVNSAIEALVPQVPSEVLSGISSGIVRVGQKAAAAVSEYSSLYAQNQLLKYNENGDPSDVTTSDRLSVADSSIANVIREMTAIRAQYVSLISQLPRRTATEIISTAIQSADRVVWFKTIEVGRYLRDADGYTVLIFIRLGFSFASGKASLVFRKEMESGKPPHMPANTYGDDALLSLLGNVMFPMHQIATSDLTLKCEMIPLFTKAATTQTMIGDQYLIPFGERDSNGYQKFLVGMFYVSINGAGVMYQGNPVTFESLPFNTVLEWSNLPNQSATEATSLGGAITGALPITERTSTVVGDTIAIAPNPVTSGIVDTAIEVSHEFNEPYVPDQTAAIDTVIDAMRNL